MPVVYLVGAGPGDPGLLTARAVELLRGADVVLYDGSVGPGILELAAAGAQRIEVTAAAGVDAEVRRLLQAAEGAEQVVRLFAGDPFILAGGGAAAEALQGAGIRYEVVPGVLEPLAAACLAGVPIGEGPLTVIAAPAGVPRRDSDEAGAERVPEPGPGTLVIRFRGGDLGGVADRLLHRGWAPDTPVAVVVNAGSALQRTVTGPLLDIAGVAERAGAGPAVAVVGETAGRAGVPSWYEVRPLHGRRIVVTRAQAQAGDLVSALGGLGAEVIRFPAIRIEAAGDPLPLRRAVQNVGEYDWVVFTSVNGVERFWLELEAAGRDARALAGARIACIGPATHAALELHGLRADVMPSSYVAEALVDALASTGELAGRRVLLPRARGARPVLPDGLEAAGAVVAEVEAYRAVPDAKDAADLRSRLDRGEVDAVTFTSPSTVDAFVAAVGAELGGAAVAAIGPITAAAARRHGLTVDLEADEYTIPGLIQALRGRLGPERRTTARAD